MSDGSLLKQQHALIEHLLNPDCFEKASSDDEFLAGMNFERLKMVGRLALLKRQKKIEDVLPHVVEALGIKFQNLCSEFASTHLQDNISKERNAGQFVDFLRSLYEENRLDPPHISDLAKFELAVWRAYHGDVEQMSPARLGDFLMAPGIQFLDCDFDIRPAVDRTYAGSSPMEKKIYLSILPVPGDDVPKVIELPRKIFIWLSKQENSAFAAISKDEIEQLLALGLIVRLA